MFEMTQIRRDQLPPERRYIACDLAWQTGPSVYEDRKEAVSWALDRNEIPYGALTAYLFRRFGYPEGGWDDGKELVRYRLTTPDDRIILEASPYAGDTASLSLRFLLETGLHRALQAYEREPAQLWRQRFDAFLHDPGRAPEWMDAARGELRQSGHWDPRSKSAWVVEALAGRRARHPEDARCAEAAALLAGFEAVDPWPGTFLRDPDPTAWPEEDPLKALVATAKAALDDLCRPVWIRDILIGPFGAIDEDDWPDEDDPATERFSAPSHPVAGQAAGRLVNAAPEVFAALEARIVALGKGDAATGLALALDRLQEPEVAAIPDEDAPAP